MNDVTNMFRLTREQVFMLVMALSEKARKTTTYTESNVYLEQVIFILQVAAASSWGQPK